MSPERIAEIAHEASRVVQAAVPVPGIPVAPEWAEFDEQQRARVVEGVVLAVDGASSEELHESWLAAKLEDGWSYGVVKDEVARTHPAMRPYEALPAPVRMKDQLFSLIVKSLAEAGVEGELWRALMAPKEGLRTGAEALRRTARAAAEDWIDSGGVIA